MKQVYLLTGKPGTGKTSLIRQIVSGLGGGAGGFYTEEIRNGGVRAGFKLITLDGEEAQLAHTGTKSRHRVSRYGVDTDSLERVGVTALERAARAGKIVIVDLSLGSETVLQFCSERIVNHILTDAARRFASGQEAHKTQIFIEEAHRLFNRDKMKAPSEADPYVRLAKEAAKFKIGLIYATQEVSSVDPLILSNTSNWIVTHLNNRLEVRELSRYYDFQDFAELTLRAEDVGFARLKTRSGRYIIPVHIDLFDRTMIDTAQEAARSASQVTSSESSGD